MPNDNMICKRITNHPRSLLNINCMERSQNILIKPQTLYVFREIVVRKVAFDESELVYSVNAYSAKLILLHHPITAVFVR